ncbi:MAG: hypothetical protein MJZ61_04280 [Bacteroidales bacterium]|nr:hypothetical protein [Bacteroidales bacterium]
MKITSARIILLFTIALISINARADIKLPHIIADNMMLQQKSKCPLWGWADPGESVTVKGSWGAKAETITGPDGKWMTQIETPKFGGTHYIDFIGKNYLRVSNVIFGDVYLASGQSNMEITMTGWAPYDTITGAYEAIQTSLNPNLRFFSAKQKVSFDLEDDTEGWWSSAGPETTLWYSAFAYFYARKLNQETGVPIGIVNASWGGSNGESWLSMPYIKEMSEFKEAVQEYEQSIPLQKKLSDWITSHHELVSEGDWMTKYVDMNYNDDECARAGFNDSQWPTMKLPCYYDNPENMGAFDGIVWFRRWVEIPEKWRGKKLILSLGPIDDMDATFVNGEQVGESLRDGMWNVPRTYNIMPGLVRSGKMLIAIRLIDNGNGGGVYGNRDVMRIYPEGQEDNPEESLPIWGEWKYLPTAEFKDDRLYQYDHKTMEFYQRPNVQVTLSPKTITGLYNSMLNPIMPYKMTGIIFYQGESNCGRAEEYTKLLPLIVQCWRDGFHNPNMKFYYAQIAPYQYNVNSMSFELREAQRRCQELIPSSGMTCLMDLGKKESMHPNSKREAAERMALWAMKDIYGKKVETSGPNYESMVVNKNSIELTFSHTTGGLVVRGEGLTDFEIADSKGNYVPANAEIQGDKVIVSSPDVTNPKNVRYCWKDWVQSPSLFNGAGLPASSFTTEKRITPKKVVYEE